MFKKIALISFLLSAFLYADSSINNYNEIFILKQAIVKLINKERENSKAITEIKKLKQEIESLKMKINSIKKEKIATLSKYQKTETSKKEKNVKIIGVIGVLKKGKVVTATYVGKRKNFILDPTTLPHNVKVIEINDTNTYINNNKKNKGAIK